MPDRLTKSETLFISISGMTGFLDSKGLHGITKNRISQVEGKPPVQETLTLGDVAHIGRFRKNLVGKRDRHFVLQVFVRIKLRHISCRDEIVPTGHSTGRMRQTHRDPWRRQFSVNRILDACHFLLVVHLTDIHVGIVLAVHMTIVDVQGVHHRIQAG